MPTSALEPELAAVTVAPAAVEAPPTPPAHGQVVELRESLRVLRANADDRVRVLKDLCEKAAVLQQRTAAVRAEAAAARQRRAG
jgi:hypothetical protein